MSERVIWRRTVDEQKIADRKQRFLKWFVAPAAIVILLVLVMGGWKNALGALVLLVGVGLFWGNAVRYQSLSDQANPTITYDGTNLKVGNRTVVVADVKAYTTMATSTQTSVLGEFSRINVGKAVFRLDDPGTRREPKLVEFGWPNMVDQGVAEVTTALALIFDDKRVEPIDLVAQEELGPRSRRRPRTI